MLCQCGAGGAFGDALLSNVYFSGGYGGSDDATPHRHDNIKRAVTGSTKNSELMNDHSLEFILSDSGFVEPIL